MKNEKFENKNFEEEKSKLDLDDLLQEQRYGFESKLKSDDYEQVAKATERIKDLDTWRQRASESGIYDFYRLSEDVGYINSKNIETEQKKELGILLADKLTQNVTKFTPRVADIYQALLSEMSGEDYEPKFDITKNKLESLKEEGVLDTLFSDGSYEVKHNNLEARLEGYIKGVRGIDYKEGHRDKQKMPEKTKKERQKHLEEESNVPPTDNDESKPGVDAMDRLKEGEKAKALWSMTPAWGGYYKDKTYSLWDEEQKTWREKDYEYSEVNPVELLKEETSSRFNLVQKVVLHANNWTPVPIPYTHDFNSVESDVECEIKRDQNGDLLIMPKSSDSSTVSVKINLAYVCKREIIGEPQVPDFFSNVFSEETEEKIEELKNSNLNIVQKAKALSSYAKRRIEYLAPEDDVESERFNNIYRTHENGFAGAVDIVKKADCDVSNTYFAALCSRLDIPVRHATGHSIKGQNENGASEINSGTGHAWSEVWDQENSEWVRIDATSAGDPNLEEDEENDNENKKYTPGDYGNEDNSEEKKEFSDEDIRKLKERLTNLAEKLSYTPQEQELASGANIELKEARQIVKEIQEAENMRLPNGERILDVLTGLFNLIVRTRKNQTFIDDGPITRAQGGQRIMPKYLVRHAIGVRAGERDPVTREKEMIEEQNEKNFGGFDVYFVGDGSSSMFGEANETGETRAELQRKATYLIFTALNNFEKSLELNNLTSGKRDKDLSVKTQGLIYKDSEDIVEVKEKGFDFTPVDKVKMWHEMGNTDGAYGAGDGINQVRSEIYTELKEKGLDPENGNGDDRLRIILMTTDGELSVEEENQLYEASKDLGRLGAVTVGIGMGDGAKNIPVVFDSPPYSSGDYSDNVEDLPEKIAKHIVLQAIKLFPDKAREDAKNSINAILDRFKK